MFDVKFIVLLRFLFAVGSSLAVVSRISHLFSCSDRRFFALSSLSGPSISSTQTPSYRSVGIFKLQIKLFVFCVLLQKFTTSQNKTRIVQIPLIRLTRILKNPQNEDFKSSSVYATFVAKIFDNVSSLRAAINGSHRL